MTTLSYLKIKKLSPNFWMVLLCISTSTLSAQNFSDVIGQQLEHFVEKDELQPEDVQWKVSSQSVSRISRIQHIYFNQVFNDLKIYGTESSIHLMSNGQVFAQNNRFIKSTAEKLFGSTSPGLTAIQAVQAAALQLNYIITQPLFILEELKGKSNEGFLSDGGISLRPIPVKLMYTLTENERLVLTWDISIEEITKQNLWSLRVDATTGEIINRANWVSNCGLEHDHSQDVERLDFNANLYDIPNYDEIHNSQPTACTECYEVFALPLESPYYGNRTIETKPAHPVASPYGWHDTNGAPGAEYTVTRGNNVNAFENGDNPGYQPDGGSNLDFTGYPFSQVYTSANQYEDAAITNLFYINNVFHDIVYQFGFDEVSGNFQENNYGKGGRGNDSVNAEAQDRMGTCNAWFMTPPDGQNPRMGLYICGDKDGDFDTMVILHEYGHGVSQRLTGGPVNVDCLYNKEQMGEGWSDYFGTLLTIQPGDVGTDPREVGTYLFGRGIREYPYSTDMSINPQTYDFIKTAVVPHGVGSVWAQMLWEVTWALIDAHGYDPNPYNFTGDINIDKGNTIALAIIMEGMKLQPCSPGFVDGRDAIFSADQAIYGGANECFLWEAFAKRGLGISANQGSSNSSIDGVEAFDTPFQKAALYVIDEACVAEGVMAGMSGGTPPGGKYNGLGVIDDGNGFTFTFDPSVAGLGTHTITYSISAGPCSSGSSAADTITILKGPEGPLTSGVSDFCVGQSVTVTAVPNDDKNTIRWYDAPSGGNQLFEGVSYTFTPVVTTSLYAEESAPGPFSKLVVSEIGLNKPHRFEIQNVGNAKDYSGYIVAVSDIRYNNINTVNSITQSLGIMASNSVVDYNGFGGPGHWGQSIYWDHTKPGWILIIDPNGKVVDSVFWNLTIAQMNSLNVNIRGHNIKTADLDWTGPAAVLDVDCGSNSFRRHGDSDSAADWTGGCEPSDFGVPNSDIDIVTAGCAGERTKTDVIIDRIDPIITCPGDLAVRVKAGLLYTIPDLSGDVMATDNCTSAPVITQSPIAGSLVGLGVTTITIIATDEAKNKATCTFAITVDESGETGNNEFYNNIQLYPNPTFGIIVLKNKTTAKLENAVITDSSGRIITTIDLSAAEMETNISLENLASGMYFIQINTERGNIVKGIIKQ